MNLPDTALVPMSWVREHFVPKADAATRDMTTVELSEEFGHSPDWWRDRVKQIPGAYQSGAHARWYVPRREATVFLDELKQARTKTRARRPWRGPQAA